MSVSLKRCPQQYLVGVRQCVSILGVGIALLYSQTVEAQRKIAARTADDGTRSAETLLARPVTVTLKHVSLKQALDSISIMAKALIQYRAPMLKAYPVPVSITAIQMPLGVVLEHVLDGTKLRAVPDGQGYLTIVPVPSETMGDSIQATGSISGRVVDSAGGRGLVGATVKIVGTKSSAVTTDSGQFILRNVPVGDRIVTVKLFGYRPIEKDVTVAENEPTTVRISLAPTPTVLSGVVTTAAGVQRRVEVGNDITVLNADSILQVAPVSNITDMLATRVPGLVVQHTSGIPGAPSRLRLRGLSSINESADPILIVDGVRVYADQSGSVSPSVYGNNGNPSGGSVTGGGSNVGRFAGPSALDQIDPNAIETVEVLKGPSATAIYGSDAANGVIVIMTKHGHVGPTHWNLNVDQGRTTLSGNWPSNDYVFCSAGWNKQASQSEVCDGNVLYENVSSSDRHVDSLVAFQALNDPRYSPLTGHAGQNHDGSLTVSGGNGALTYSVTGTASTQSGYLHLPLIELQRFESFHGFSAPTWMRTPDQYVTYGENSQLTVQLNKGGGQLTLSDAIFHSAQQQSSLQTDLANLSQSYVDTTQLAAQPLFPDYYTRAQFSTIHFTNAVTLSNWAPWHVLPITATAGLDVQDQDNNTLTPRDYMLGTSDSLGAYQLSQGTNTNATLNVSTTLRQRLVNTALGINVYTVTQSNYGASTTGLPVGVQVPNSFSYVNGQGPSYSTANTATYGWYVQPAFNFGNRFFASPGFRLDGGSNSGTTGKSTGSGSGGVLSLFPKLDFSWIALQRSPSNPLFGLVLLRPRIAFGIAGIQPGPGQQLSLLQPAQITPVTTTSSGSTPVDILQVQTVGNPTLVPERDREVEGGFDAEFWNQRLTLTLTGYHKLAYDAILAVPIAPSVLGTWTQNSEAVNVGTIKNTGIEATIGARLLDSRMVDWSVNANFTKNDNQLVNLVAGQPPISNPIESGITSRLTPGYPLFGEWARPIVGYYDGNHDGLIGPGEVRVGDSAVYVGAQQPNYELAMSTVVRFFNGRLTFNTEVDYQNGLTQYRSNSFSDVAFSLTPDEQVARAACSEGASCIGLLQTVNTLRWQTLSVGYLVPPRVAHLLRVPTLSVALQGSNLGLHTNYHGKDPGVNALASGNQTQDDGNSLPQPRIWNLRVTIGN